MLAQVYTTKILHICTQTHADIYKCIYKCIYTHMCVVFIDPVVLFQTTHLWKFGKHRACIQGWYYRHQIKAHWCSCKHACTNEPTGTNTRTPTYACKNTNTHMHKNTYLHSLTYRHTRRANAFQWCRCWFSMAFTWCRCAFFHTNDLDNDVVTKPISPLRLRHSKMLKLNVIGTN